MKTKELRIVGREKALERFDKAIERITDLKDRINTHINKLEAKEVAVVDAKKFVAIADTKIKDAKDKITEINLLFSLSIDKLTMENKTKLKTLIKSTQTLIVEAHKALKDAIKSLKDGVKIKMESEVSTTIEDNQ
jgi:hypothetical protein